MELEDDDVVSGSEGEDNSQWVYEMNQWTTQQDKKIDTKRKEEVNDDLSLIKETL